MTLGELVAQFPEYDNILLGGMGYKQDLNGQVEIIRYYDKDQSVVYVPAKDNLILSQAKNPLGKMMIVVARKPSIDGDLRGQFDDVEKMYKALTHILDHDQLKDDWFEDTDGDLKDRVAKFMEAFGYKEIADVDGDGIPDHLDDHIG